MRVGKPDVTTLVDMDFSEEIFLNGVRRLSRSLWLCGFETETLQDFWDAFHTCDINKETSRQNFGFEPCLDMTMQQHSTIRTYYQYPFLKTLLKKWEILIFDVEKYVQVEKFNQYLHGNSRRFLYTLDCQFRAIIGETCMQINDLE